ncbi:S41 family peptidase [Actomonas aquatica]|uniref:S41 family peptidase n=1 Tax=Actomonas aquatica TaxID=2866162 RepID=A0ABZ1CDE7_9BACT|nr:S41 family peptidase [Opitutus sp. WL0086]WRQ89508.1 S41 family peptidase [Opitutus sp. WL0086]
MKSLMFRFTRTVALCASALFISGAAAQSVPSALQGIWRSDGYGWILQANGNQITRYHESSAGLVVGPSDASELRAEFSSASVVDADHIIAGNPTEGSAYHFTRLSALPGAVTQPGNASPTQTLDYAIAYLQDHYAVTAAHGIDWTARFATARSQVSNGSSSTALRNALLQMIDGTTDAHLRLLWPSGNSVAYGPDFNSRVTVPLIEAAHLGTGATRQTRYDSWRQQRILDHIYHLLDLGASGAAGGAVMWHREGTMGYLFIADMIGFTDTESVSADVTEINSILDLALTELNGVEEMIVDVSLNGGGRDAVSRAIAARFTAAPVTAYTKHPGDGSTDALQTITIAPTARPSFLGPVHLITSDLTLSAAEVFTLAMRALPNVCHFGMTTHGSMSDMLIKPLPNGWFIAASNEIYTDADGEVWEGRGITPEVELPIFTAATINQAHFDRIASFADQLVHPEPTPEPQPEPEPEPQPEPEPEPEPQPEPSLEPQVEGLFNLSTRAYVGNGNETLISGLMIEGTGTRDLAIIARGPSLADYGLTTAVADVRLRVLNAALEEIAAVDALTDISAEDRAELAAYGILPGNPNEAALILRNVPAGAYHIHLSAQDTTPGVGILEIFDISADADDDTVLFNLSSRAAVGTGESVAVTGFIITGEEEVGVLIRAQGPSLRQHGITNALEDPMLSLLEMGGTEVLAENHNYTELDPELRAALEADGVGVGDDTESVLILFLPPGAYTALLDAEPGTDHGVALIEFFRIEE